jgi:putative DNA primase/helicase
LAEFLEDRCILKPSAIVPKHELRKSYEDWADKNGTTLIPARVFSNRIVEKGITETRTGSTRFWRGIGLLTENQEQEKLIDDAVTKQNSNVRDVSFVNDAQMTNMTLNPESFLYEKNIEKLPEMTDTSVILSQGYEQNNEVCDTSLKKRPQKEGKKAPKNEEKIPDYPIELCQVCGGDWYLSKNNEWKCVNCEPEYKNE